MQRAMSSLRPSSDTPNTPATTGKNLTGWSVSIGGKTLPITVERVEVAKLNLDLKNPRLHAELGFKGRDDLSAEEVAAKIWEQNDTKQLFQQILQDGGLIEPPFVKPDNTIAEGNRRKVCLDKILYDEDLAEQNGVTDDMRKQFEYVYIYRLPAHATDLDILKLLLDWHVSSKKAWTKPDQTEILFRLHENGIPVEELARRTRETKDKMQNRLDSYRLLLKHRERSPNSTAKLQSNLLSHYREILNNDELRAWIKGDKRNQELFDMWVTKKRIRSAKDTRDMLPAILTDENGLAMLVEEEMTVKEAYNELGKAKKKTVFDDMVAVAMAMDEAPYKDIADYSTNAAKRRKLRRLERAISVLKERVGGNGRGDD